MMAIMLYIMSLSCLAWATITFLVLAGTRMFERQGVDRAKINIGISNWFIAGGVLWIAATYTAVVT